MKNLKGDILWSLLLLLWIIMLVVPALREQFLSITESHPYIGGFVKFFLLASMGDMLGFRVLHNRWQFPQGFIAKAVLWGLLGIAITLVFTVYMSGASAAMTSGRLPFAGHRFALAFFGSSIMNLTFGPMMYVYHKFGDLYIDAKIQHGGKVTVKELVDKLDWYGLVSFSWLKTCLFVWIPMHTLVFLLPSEYRVLASAFLSILLGILVALSKKGGINESVVEA